VRLVWNTEPGVDEEEEEEEELAADSVAILDRREKRLGKFTGKELVLSFAYHPSTDGQSGKAAKNTRTQRGALQS